MNHSIASQYFLLASAVVVMSFLFQSDRTNQIEVAKMHVDLYSGGLRWCSVAIYSCI